MYTLIRALLTHPDRRSEVAELLIDCLRHERQAILFLVGKEVDNNDGIIVTEMWQDRKYRDVALGSLVHRKTLRTVARLIVSSRVIFEGEGSLEPGIKQS